MLITVRRGDTLWNFSRVFGLPLDLILDSNRGINPDALQAGQRVNIPGYRVQQQTVLRGDTLWQIARRRGIDSNALLLLNPGINPDRLQAGSQINIPQRVVAPVIRGRRTYDYNALRQDLATLKDIYPFMIRRQIGSSVMGKEISELQIGRGLKRVHFNASFHANEWITTPILMQTVNEYLLALTNNYAIRGRAMLPFYYSVLLSIVPMVNPDGVDLVIHGAPRQEPYRSQVLSINSGSSDFSLWKANIRGVDLNNQYPAFWEREAAEGPWQPSPRDFPGYAPLTEPEAISMANLVRESNFTRLLSYHTQGKVIYWGFMGMEPPESETIVAEFARVSGYQPIRYIPSYAGFKNWFIQEWRRPGFTVELGRGVNPLPINQFDEIYEENLGIFLASLYM